MSTADKNNVDDIIKLVQSSGAATSQRVTKDGLELTLLFPTAHLKASSTRELLSHLMGNML